MGKYIKLYRLAEQAKGDELVLAPHASFCLEKDQSIIGGRYLERDTRMRIIENASGRLIITQITGGFTLDASRLDIDRL